MNLTIINTMLSSVCNLIEGLTTTSKEKEKLKSEVSYVIMQHLDKLTEAQKDVIIEEAKGNFLQRSWRPIVMLTFTFIVVLGIFIDIPLLKDGSPFWDLLEIGLGGYVIGRSAEKITTTIGKKMK